MSYGSDNDNIWVNLLARLIAGTVVVGLTWGFMKLLGKSYLDFPNYPINIDSPVISDGDNNIVANDFSIVDTNDGKSHLCYEKKENGVTNYFDVDAKVIIDKNTIKSIKRFEDYLSSQVPTTKGYGDANKLRDVVSSTIEEYNKTLVK